MLGLGIAVAVAMAPVGASGHKCHGVAKIDTGIVTWQGGGVTSSRVPVLSCAYLGYCNILRQVPIRLMEFSME